MRHAKSVSIVSKAEAALKKAVQKVVREHAQTGLPLIVWKNGRVVRERPGRSRIKKG
jgi:hypothetical protein